MNLEREVVRSSIRDKIAELAARGGNNTAGVGDDDIIPFAGILDSAALLELVVWYENHYNVSLKQEEINIDNLGSVNAMTDYLLRRKSS